MPSRFTWQDADVYLPLKLPGGANDLYDPTMRLRPGVTHAAANAELQPLLEQFAKETPSHFPKKFRVHVKGLNEQYVSHLGHSLFLLLDRKSTRLNSSHVAISYAVFCLKKKNNTTTLKQYVAQK